MANGGKIGVGVVGLGFMGSTHVVAYQSAEHDGYPCKLIAACDREPDRRAGFLRNVGGNIETGGARQRAFDPATVHSYASADELFADSSVDLVSICTPTDSHVEFASAALRAGKHVLCEKPVSLHVDEILKLDEVAKSTGKICMPAMCMRFWPGWSWLKQKIDDREFGACRILHLMRLGAMPNWSPGFYDNVARSGGALVDLHLHDADFIYHCFGSPCTVSSSGTINHITTRYTFHDDREVIAEGGWLEAGTPFRMTFHATFESVTREFDSRRDMSDLSGYDLEIRHMIDLLVGRATKPIATLADAANVMALLDAERRSLDTHRPVEYKPLGDL